MQKTNCLKSAIFQGDSQDIGNMKYSLYSKLFQMLYKIRIKTAGRTQKLRSGSLLSIENASILSQESLCYYSSNSCHTDYGGCKITNGQNYTFFSRVNWITKLHASDVTHTQIDNTVQNLCMKVYGFS